MTAVETKLRLAMIEFLYHSYAGELDCSCEADIQCRECQGMEALGLGRFTGETSTWNSLRAEQLRVLRVTNLRSVP